MSPLIIYSFDSLALSQKISFSSLTLGFIYNHHINYNHIHSHSRPSLSTHKHNQSLFSPYKPQSHNNPSFLYTFSPNNNKTPTLNNPIFSSKMATCVDTSRAEPTKKCDHYKYVNYCRPSFSNNQKTIHSRSVIEDILDEDDLWYKMLQEGKNDVEKEPILSNYYYNSILSHKCLESALANHLAAKLSFSSLNANTLFDLFFSVLYDDRDIMRSVKADLRAVKERDPACVSYVQCFLNFKGFLACQAHRIAHKLWSQRRKILALMIQNRVSEVFSVDIHPGAKIGRGILLDHATGMVVGETAVIGNNVSILHNVTLGGTGKACGDRHPKIGDGVLIGAGTCVLGNVKVGDGAKIGAGSVVLKEVPPRTTAVGNPARLVGGKENPIKLDKIPSLTMDHTSHIHEWSDYVI